MAGIKGKSGRKEGHTGGRTIGAKNKVTYDVKKKLAEGLTEGFVSDIYVDILKIEKPEERVKAKLKLLEFFIPKPREQEEKEKEDEFRRAFMEKMFPKRD